MRQAQCKRGRLQCSLRAKALLTVSKRVTRVIQTYKPGDVLNESSD